VLQLTVGERQGHGHVSCRVPFDEDGIGVFVLALYFITRVYATLELFQFTEVAIVTRISDQTDMAHDIVWATRAPQPQEGNVTVAHNIVEDI